MKKISIIIPVFNRKEITLNCLRYLSRIVDSITAYKLTIVIVDDASTDGTSEAIHNSYENIVVLQGAGDLWWTGAINLGVNYSLKHDFDYVLLLNDDLVLDVNFITYLLSASEEKPNALISSIKLHRDGANSKIVVGQMLVKSFFQTTHDHLYMKAFHVNELPRYLDCDLLTGASLLVPIKVFNKIGVLDEKCFPHNWGDFEFTRRAKISGYDCVVCTESMVFSDLDNPNYHSNYFVTSTRLMYLKNLFDNHKYTYGFSRIWYASMMHKPMYVGLLLVLKRYIGLLKLLSLKIFLPKAILSALFR